MLKDDSILDTFEYYFKTGYDEGYSNAKEESKKRIAWLRRIIEQLRDDNAELRSELNSVRTRWYGE